MNYTTEEIYQMIILPLFNNFKGELLGFADKNVHVTKEKPGGTPGPGWTFLLAAQGLINKSEAGGKYIELERCLSSIVAFYLILDGSDAAYNKFICTQNKNEQLSRESFASLHKLAKERAPNEEKNNLIIAMLIYSDLGKTPSARRRALEHKVEEPDHDDWIEHVLSLDNNGINYVLPSFFSLKTEQKKNLKAIASSLKVHLGHVLHLEGGIHMFDKLLIALKSGGVTLEEFKLAFLIQMCDVSASQGQVTNMGLTAMTENTFQAYQMVWQCLERLFHKQSAEEALQHYIRVRGERLGINSDNPRSQILIRLACMLRLYTKESGEKLQKIVSQIFDETTWKILEEQLGMLQGMNQWRRNPTYVPAVLLNLMRLEDQSEPLEAKLSRALQGSVCIAKILQHYAGNNERKASETPLCFNKLAGTASVHPEFFNMKEFNCENLQYDKDNNVVYETRKSELTLVIK